MQIYKKIFKIYDIFKFWEHYQAFKNICSFFRAHLVGSCGVPVTPVTVAPVPPVMEAPLYRWHRHEATKVLVALMLLLALHGTAGYILRGRLQAANSSIPLGRLQAANSSIPLQ